MTITFECTTFRVCELVCACGPACMRHISDEMNYVYGNIYKYMFVFATKYYYLLLLLLFVGVTC